jgi:hypothetical protein
MVYKFDQKDLIVIKEYNNKICFLDFMTQMNMKKLGNNDDRNYYNL